MKPKVYILDAFHPSGVEIIAAHADTVQFGDPRGARWHDDAEAVMVRGKVLKADDFTKAKKLKVVAKQGVGVNSIDLDAAKAHGVMVINTPGVNTEAVAELALALTLSVGRRLAELDRLIRSGQPVDRTKLLGLELSGKRVGIIGMGNVGTRVAGKFLHAFGVRLIAYDPYVPASHWAALPHERAQSLEQLLADADVVTVHVPLTAETRHLIGVRELARMKPTAILINTARGGIVDEPALYDALNAGRLFGAGLDVFEKEPPRADHPLVSLPNVVATPHSAGSTHETQQRSSTLIAEQLIAVLAGHAPLSRVV